MTDQPNEGAGDATPPPPPPPPPPPSTPSSGPVVPPPPPITSGGSVPPPPPPVPVSASSAVDVGAAASWAFDKFKKFAPVFIGLAAVVFVLRLIQQLLADWFLNLVGGSCSPTVVGENGVVVTNTACIANAGAGIAASVVSAIVFGVLTWIATIGVYRAALRTSNGETPAFSDMTTGQNLGKYIIVAIVFGVLMMVGLALCIIPGLLVIFFLQFAPWYALDKGYGVGQSFSASIAAVKSAPVPVILAMIVTAIAALLGGVLWGLLTLVTLPFAALFVVHVYRQLNREPIAP